MTQEHSLPSESVSRRLPKEERLHHKKLIEELFRKGSSFLIYPYRFVYLLHPEAPQDRVQVLISVSKKHFKRAVDRNRLKRQAREAYRQHKHSLVQSLPLSACNLLAIQYVAKEKLPFSVLEKKLSSGLERLLNN